MRHRRYPSGSGQRQRRNPGETAENGVSRSVRNSRRKKWRKPFWQAKNDLDSVGGIVEVCATGLPGGIGGAMYDGLESYLAPIFFGIPAVKGVEFGAGFHAAELRGSENNDPFYYDNHGQVKTRTNYHGGSWRHHHRHAASGPTRFQADSFHQQEAGFGGSGST